MKKNTMPAGTLTVFILLAFLLVTAAALRQTKAPAEKETYPIMSLSGAARSSERMPEAEPDAPAALETRPLYTVMEYNGRLAVFTALDGSLPEIITTIETERMRKADREIFQKGVSVSTDEELCRLLEDFGS